MAKEGNSDAPMLKIKKMMEEEKKVRVDTIFQQFLFQYQKRYVDLRISNNSLNKLLRAVFLSDSSQNTARNNLFEELFRGITLDDVFDDVTSKKTRNKVRRIKTADTLVEGSGSIQIRQLFSNFENSNI
jgi:predicted DNA-binding ArsR family transcriptional regulator